MKSHPPKEIRRLRLYGGSVASISGLLLSATALTDLTLSVTSTHAAVFDPSQGSFLLACLRGMQCLRSLDLATGFDFRKTCRPRFNSQRYCPIIKVNTFPLFRPYHILGQVHVRAFSSIPPRCSLCALHQFTPFVPLSGCRRREGRISVGQCNFRKGSFR
jgi:hypothetical protein